MERKLNEAAKTLLSLAKNLASAGGRIEVSGVDLLLAALRQPFPAFSVAFHGTKLTLGKIADQMESLLRVIDFGEADVQPFDEILAELVRRSDGEAGPEVLVRAALRQNDPGTKELTALLKSIDGQLIDRLSSLAPAPPPPEEGPSLKGGPVEGVELRLESISPRVMLYLSQAQGLAGDRQISIRQLIRVCLSDLGGFLSRGLLAVGAYEPVLRTVGGKVRPSAKRVKFELDRCTNDLRLILKRALEFSKRDGQDFIDERALALALIADARQDSPTDFSSIVERLPDLEAWVEKQDSLAGEDATIGEIPIDQIVPFLQSSVVNQDHAIKEVYRPIMRVRLGLGFEDALAAVLLFVGPPGVGKSYLAKLMAQVLYGHDPANPEAHFVMIECGRYKDSHAVTDLIGAPHGYVGSDKGILRDGVRDKYPA